MRRSGFRAASMGSAPEFSSSAIFSSRSRATWCWRASAPASGSPASPSSGGWSRSLNCSFAGRSASTPSGSCSARRKPDSFPASSFISPTGFRRASGRVRWRSFPRRAWLPASSARRSPARCCRCAAPAALTGGSGCFSSKVFRPSCLAWWRCSISTMVRPRRDGCRRLKRGG